MNKAFVWWTLVNSAAALIEQIKNRVENRENVFISCENSLPWKDTFYELSRNALAEISSQRSLEFISAAGENDPGRFLMMRMCPASVRSEYWPDMTCAEFLSQRNDLILNNRIVWVKDVENDMLLEKWFEFISEYCRLSEEQSHEHAIFIVEYVGKNVNKKPPSIINTIKFSATYFDRYIFALSMLSELSVESVIKQYVAELACSLCKDNVELCGLLAESGIKLAQNPNMCVKEQFEIGRSDTSVFSDPGTDEIYSGILMAQIKIIFPVIEQFRLNFIKTHESIIRKNLPIVNSLNEKVEEPNELELSGLCSVSRSYMSGFTETEKSMLLKYRNYRNKLAHNGIIDWQDVEKILCR